MENVKLLFQLYFRPAAAMSDIIDQGSWIFAAVAMLVVSFAFQYTVNMRIAQSYQVSAFAGSLQDQNYTDTDDAKELSDKAHSGETVRIPPAEIRDELRKKPFPVIGHSILYLFSFEEFFISTLVSLSLFFVPALLILARILDAAGYAGTNARNNFLPLVTCTMMAWVAAHAPFAIAGAALIVQPVDGLVFLLMWLVSGLLFGALTVFAVRTVMGVNYGLSAMIVILAAFAFPLGMYVFRYVSPHLFSPFLIIMAVLYFGGFLSSEARGFGNAFRQRQNFKRYLHSSTVNPRDADAHVQLALIYLQRKQDAKALEHLNKAFEIDPEEIDANYELGRVARRKKELQQALDHFSVVVEQNDKHSLSEIWREIGATYMEAGMFAEAREALETFTARRPFDTEGLYYFGKVLKSLGETEKAREAFEQAVEAAKNAPRHRRHEIMHWGKLAQKEI